LRTKRGIILSVYATVGLRFGTTVTISLADPKAFFCSLSLRTQLCAMAVAGFAMLASITVLFPDDGDDNKLLDEYGQILAEQVARLSVDSFVKQDTIYLNVLAERVSAATSVTNVVIFAVDGQQLAAYGEFDLADLLVYNAPILLEDSVVGYARISLPHNALQAQRRLPWIPQILALLATLCLIWWLTQPAASQPPQLQSSEAGHRDKELFLLVVNLFNQLDLDAVERETVLRECERGIAAVAELYDAEWGTMIGTGFLLVFDANGDDRGFEAACAALVLANLFAQIETRGQFRFSLQAEALSYANSAPGANWLDLLRDNNALEDAILLSAVADNAAVAMSIAFVGQLARPERLLMTHEQNSALSSLRTETGSGYYLMRAAAPPTAELLARQVLSLQR
jgi:hypothetical protein